MTTSEWLTRAEDDLVAARVLMETGHPSAAVSRAYYAAFYAAKAALDSRGHDPSTHAGVNSAFGRYVVKEGGANPDAGRTFNRLLDRRTLADYEVESMTEADARAAVDSAPAGRRCRQDLAWAGALRASPRPTRETTVSRMYAAVPHRHNCASGRRASR